MNTREKIIRQHAKVWTLLDPLSKASILIDGLCAEIDELRTLLEALTQTARAAHTGTVKEPTETPP